MKRFDFSLERVLEFRDYQKRAAQADLSRSLAKENAILSQIDNVIYANANTTKSTQGETNFSLLSNASVYINFLRVKQSELNSSLEEVKIVSEEKRQILQKAMQKEKVLEKLKEKKAALYKEEQLKKEDKILDDIATNKHNRS